VIDFNLIIKNMDEKFVRVNDIKIRKKNGIIRVSSDSMNIKINLNLIAVEVIRYCNKPRSRDDIKKNYGSDGSIVFDILRENSLLVRKEDADITPAFYKSFENFNAHRSMLSDSFRVSQYKRAIDESVKKGDIVIDAGSGTGLLAVLAAKAGAKKVYAIEASNYAKIAKKTAFDSGVSKKIEVIQDDFSRVKLPEKVDVLITETFGSLIFNEGAAPDLKNCIKKNLKKDAILIPGSVSFYVGTLKRQPTCFREMSSLLKYGVDLSFFQKKSENIPIRLRLNSSDIAESVHLGTYSILTDLSKDDFYINAKISGPTEFIAMWFELHLSPTTTISTAPTCIENYFSHWGGQVVIPFNLDSGEHKLSCKFKFLKYNRRRIVIEFDSPFKKNVVL